MPSTTTGFALDQTARDAIGRELNYFDALVEPSGNAASRQLLSLLGSAPARQQYTTMAGPAMDTMALAPAALRRASEDAGFFADAPQRTAQPGLQGQTTSLTPGIQPLGDINQAIQYLQTSNPQMLHLIRQAAMKYFGTNPSFVDPRYAKSLTPVSTSETNLSDSEKAMQWLNLALGAAGAFAG